MPKDLNYYIFSPWTETGGVEGLHQLCYELVCAGENAKMVYRENFTDKLQPEFNGRVYSRYQQYSGLTSYVPDDINDLDLEENIIILPEITSIQTVEFFKKAKVVLWRLAAVAPSNTAGYMNNIGHPIHKKIYQACDTRVAYEKIESYGKIDMNKVFMLTANINEKHFKDESYFNNNRENCIVFLPWKSHQYSVKIIESLAKRADTPLDAKVFPISGMSQEDVEKILYSSKIFIEFGTLPGKDRMGREAVMAGCVLVMGDRNSGGSYWDFPLENKFEYNEETDSYNYDLIAEKIIDIFNNYKKYFDEQKQYRDFVRQEREIFKKQVSNFIELMEQDNEV